MHRFVTVAALTVLLATPALAQPVQRKGAAPAPLPATGILVFSNACQIMPDDDAAGVTIRITRAATGDTLIFSEPQGGRRVPTQATDVKIASSAISFSVQSEAEKSYRMEPRQMKGSISGNQIEVLQVGADASETLTLPRQDVNFRPTDCPR